MMWFGRKDKKDKLDSQSFSDILRLLELTAKKLNILEGRVELIDGKLRKKIYRGSEGSSEEDERPAASAVEQHNDGFDSLRELRKTL